MSYMLPHLHSGWEVDQAILTEEDRVVVVRFGRDSDPTCMIQDEGEWFSVFVRLLPNCALVYPLALEK